MSKSESIRQFMDVYWDKTGTVFMIYYECLISSYVKLYLLGNNFDLPGSHKKVPGKFYPIDIDYGQVSIQLLPIAFSVMRLLLLVSKLIIV